jgi:hypothetical protein
MVSPNTFVFSTSLEKIWNLQYILDEKIASCAVWFWNLVFYIKGGMQAKVTILKKGDEYGEWRRLHNVELKSLYRSPNIVRVINKEIKMSRSFSQTGRRQESFQNFNRQTYWTSQRVWLLTVRSRVRLPAFA